MGRGGEEQWEEGRGAVGGGEEQQGEGGGAVGEGRGAVGGGERGSGGRGEGQWGEGRGAVGGGERSSGVVHWLSEVTSIGGATMGTLSHASLYLVSRGQTHTVWVWPRETTLYLVSVPDSSRTALSGTETTLYPPCLTSQPSLSPAWNCFQYQSMLGKILAH